MLKKQSKKSQVKMFENIGVMIIFFFLLSFGIIFYNRYQTVSINHDIKDAAIKNAIQSSRRVFYLPEIQCSETQVENCVDLLKLNGFTDVLKDVLDAQDKKAYDFYYNMLGKSTISFEQIYPITGTKVLYDNPISQGSKPKVIKTVIPISVFNPIYKIYSYGVLNVSIYVKQDQ